MPSIDTIKIIGVAVILSLFGFLLYDRQALKTDIADQKVAITQLQDANEAFAAAVARQNAAVAAAAKQRADMEAQYQAAMQEAAIKAEVSKRQQLAILNQKVVGDHCLYAHRLLTGFMKGRHP